MPYNIRVKKAEAIPITTYYENIDYCYETIIVDGQEYKVAELTEHPSESYISFLIKGEVPKELAEDYFSITYWDEEDGEAIHHVRSDRYFYSYDNDSDAGRAIIEYEYGEDIAARIYDIDVF